MTGTGSGEADALMGRSARALPLGTVTFLLTDVEGSSRHWEADPAAAEALGRHEKIIADCVAGHRGARPVEQGEGDSSVSAFSRASDAAACATPEVTSCVGKQADGRGRSLLAARR
jgi:class 3 adenylate cyclase